jgi:polyphosphate kinase
MLRGSQGVYVFALLLALCAPLHAQTAAEARALQGEVYGIEAQSLRADDMPRLIELQAKAEAYGSKGLPTQEVVNYLVQLRKLAQLQDTLHTPVRDAQGKTVPRSQVEAEANALRAELLLLRRLGQLLNPPPGGARDARGRFMSAEATQAEIARLRTLLKHTTDGLPLLATSDSTPQRPEAREFLNREVSFVEFNRRVIGQAQDSRVPLLERARFLSIASSNLDEFFGVRVSGLKQEVRAGREAPRADGYTPQETYRDALLQARNLVELQYEVWNAEVLPALKSEGIELLPRERWSSQTRSWAVAEANSLGESVNVQELKGAELPRLNDKALYLVAHQNGKPTHVVEVPGGASQVLKAPGDGTRLVLLGDAIAAQLQQQLGRGVQVSELRVTRNADSWGRQGSAEHRYGEPVRLEISARTPESVVEDLRTRLGLSEAEVVRTKGPVDLQRLGDLVDQAKTGREALLYKPFTASTRPEHQRLFETLSKGDLLLHHPFQSFQPVVDLVRQAAADAQVTEIRQSLYRTGGPNTPVIDALVEAAEAGKRVVVVIELKARFDEVNNLGNVERLRKAGAQVHFGPVGHKVHAKMLQVVRMEGGQARHYTNLNTGNYNAGSARFYTDLSYMTKSEVVGKDVASIFEELTGKRTAAAGLTQVLRAPFTMQSTFLELIEAEAQAAREGREARITLKMNSLNDPKLIRALYAASQAGVQIDLIVRGVCTLKPGVPGMSETITVRSVVGRLLEHSRIYQFHAGGQQRTWIGSADWMVRNTERRVETAVEVQDPRIKAELNELLRTYKADNVQAWTLRSDGRYERVTSEGPERIAQDEMIEKHRPRAPPPSAELLSRAPANWAEELRTFDAGLREVHKLGIEVVEGKEATVRGTSKGTVQVTTAALEALHQNALSQAGSAHEKAQARRAALGEALETAASELLARQKASGGELYRRGTQARVGQGAGAQVQAGETTAKAALGWLGKYRLPDMTLNTKAMAKDGVVRTLSSTGKFTLAIFLREFGYAVATKDRGRLEAFFEMVASTEFYAHYGMFVGGAFAGEVAYDLLYRRYLKRYLADGTLHRLARSNAALAGGLALPMLINGEWDGQTFSISLASLGISSFAVQGAMSRIPWVRRLQTAAATGRRLARVGGWVYQAGELAIVLTIGGELEQWAHGKLERWEAEAQLEEAARTLVQTLAQDDLSDEAAAEALRAYARAWDDYRVYLYRPLFAAQARFQSSLQPFLRQERLRDDVARSAERHSVGVGAKLAERLEKLAQGADAKRDGELRAMVEAFDGDFQEALAEVYAAPRRDEPLFSPRLVEGILAVGWESRAAMVAGAHGHASANRLQTYDDEREALALVEKLLEGRHAAALARAGERLEQLAAEDAAMFRQEAQSGLKDQLPGQDR